MPHKFPGTWHSPEGSTAARRERRGGATGAEALGYVVAPV